MAKPTTITTRNKMAEVGPKRTWVGVAVIVDVLILRLLVSEALRPLHGVATMRRRGGTAHREETPTFGRGVPNFRQCQPKKHPVAFDVAVDLWRRRGFALPLSEAA